MPELPEVQTIVNDLQKVIRRKKITNVEARFKNIVRGDVKEFEKVLIGNSIKEIRRRGKLMIMELTGWLHTPVWSQSAVISSWQLGSTAIGRANGLRTMEPAGEPASQMTQKKRFLLIHLKMTGQLIYQHGKQVIVGGHKLPLELPKLPNKHTHVIVTFSDGSRLLFNDQRKFGYMKIAGAEELKKIESEYGVEPLSKSFTLGNFASAIQGRGYGTSAFDSPFTFLAREGSGMPLRRHNPFKGYQTRKSGRTIKQLLMDQTKIAGIGNIYSDEICFCAQVRPDRKAGSLNLNVTKMLHKCVKQVLRLAIKYRGTTFRDYMDSRGQKGNFSRFLKVYDREGEKCSRCGSVLKGKKIGGRSSVYCAKCQH